MDQAKAQLVIPAITMPILFLFPESPEFWTKRNKEKVQQTIQMHHIVKMVLIFEISFLESTKIDQILQRQSVSIGKCKISYTAIAREN